MLDLLQVTVSSPDGGSILLEDIGASFGRGRLCALIGPSGSGKSTLLRAVAGMMELQEGRVCWDGVDLEEQDLPPGRLGYVPQFTISQEHLTAAENVLLAVRLRRAGLDRREQAELVAGLLERTGLGEAAETLARHLSGGQRRRLALAMELVTDPPLLLCDEVTSGLDARSEAEITGLLHDLAAEGRRTVLVVTHGLRHLARFDTVALLYGGRLVYCGPPSLLAHYFRVDQPEDVFDQLPNRTADEWQRSWCKHGAAIAGGPEDDQPVESGVVGRSDESSLRLPRPWTQMLALLVSRWKVFWRSRAEIGLQFGLVLGFPLVVAIFAMDGLPPVPVMDSALSGDVLRQVNESRAFVEGASRAGSMVSGLVLLQVILLGLLGANNAAREIAGERAQFEKERFSGLHPASYVASKAVFLSILVLLQSAWMTLFVRWVGAFPGPWETHFVFLLLMNAALTSICLAVSSLSRSPGQASMISIYLVGFQLPLSGAVLALPDFLGPLLRPFIAAYWSWSGVLEGLRDTRYHAILELVVPSPLSPATLCLWVLLLHVGAGLFLAWVGCLRASWD